LLLIYRELNILCVKYSLYSPYGDDVIKQDGASSCSHITDTCRYALSFEGRCFCF